MCLGNSSTLSDLALELFQVAPIHLPMTNLDSILKSIDITLPTKVHIVKGMVLLVVMY